jgi:hypothetical protein
MASNATIAEWLEEEIARFRRNYSEYASAVTSAGLSSNITAFAKKWDSLRFSDRRVARFLTSAPDRKGISLAFLSLSVAFFSLAVAGFGVKSPRLFRIALIVALMTGFFLWIIFLCHYLAGFFASDLCSSAKYLRFDTYTPL